MQLEPVNVTPVIAQLSSEDAQTLRSAGLTVDELVRAAAEVLRQSQIRATAPAHGLSAKEEEFLKQAGAKGVGEPAPGAIARNVAVVSEEYGELLKAALTGRQIASRLGVTPGRVSQRAAKGQLFGMMGRNGMVVYPAFQLCENQLLPGLDQVVAAIPRGANAVAVARFFMTPHPDLHSTEGLVSPRDWLLAGNDPRVVVPLASELVGAI